MRTYKLVKSYYLSTLKYSYSSTKSFIKYDIFLLNDKYFILYDNNNNSLFNSKSHNDVIGKIDYINDNITYNLIWLGKDYINNELIEYIKNVKFTPHYYNNKNDMIPDRIRVERKIKIENILNR